MRIGCAAYARERGPQCFVAGERFDQLGQARPFVGMIRAEAEPAIEAPAPIVLLRQQQLRDRSPDLGPAIEAAFELAESELRLVEPKLLRGMPEKFGQRRLGV